MRLTLHPQGRHRPHPVPTPIVETWEQARTWYRPTHERLWPRLVRLIRG